MKNEHGFNLHSAMILLKKDNVDVIVSVTNSKINYSEMGILLSIEVVLKFNCLECGPISISYGPRLI